MSDGWEDVNDPKEIRKVLGTRAATNMMGVNVTEGAGNVGSQEAKTREAQQGQIGQLKQFVQNLARAEVYNQALPTGRWKARVNSVQQEFPSSWQNRDVANYQTFMSLRQSLLKPSIALTTPPSATTSSKEMDTPKELEMAMSVVPGPEKESGANRAIADRLSLQAMEQIARNSFMQKWRATYGSTHAKSKTGETADEAFLRFMASPRSANVRKPISQIVAEGRARRAKLREKSAKPSIIDFNDL
jgi:hypothetical protein